MSIRQVSISINRNTLDDSQVVSRILLGETALFEILMRRYNQKLYRIIHGYFTHDDDIEDIMQETYMRAFEKLEQYRHESAFSTWLIRIGINTALMRLRAKERQNLSMTGYANEVSLLQKNHTRQYADSKMIEDEMKGLLEKAIDNLPEKYKVVYIMKHIEGMELEEIAQCLQITENNVKVRLHRAKNHLKERLLHLCSDAEIFNYGNTRCDNLVQQVMGKILKHY